MPNNAVAWAAAAGRTARRLSSAYPDAVNDAAKHAKRELTGAARDMAGPDQRLSGVGKRGARISVGYNVRRDGDRSSALVIARGPWQLVEGDTKAHTIPRQRFTKKGRRTAATRRRVVRTPYGPRSVVNHPGTKGKGRYRYIRGELRRDTEKIIVRAHSRALARATGGR